MGHYYSQTPASVSNKTLISFNYGGRTYQAWTDNEVFSKNDLDRGTQVLLDFLLADLHAGALPKLTAANAADGNARVTYLDLACGWGAISLVLAAHFANLDLYLSDVNERACNLAKVNLTMAKLPYKALAAQADFAAWGEQKFELLTLNPPIRIGKAAVMRLLLECLQHLELGGLFYCVIGKKQGAASYAKFLQEYAALHLNYGYELIGKDKNFCVFKLWRKHEA